MASIKPSQIKLRSLVKFKDDDTEWIIVSKDLSNKTVWAERANSLRKIKKPMSEIIKLDRKPVEIKY